jgi:uroporphyrin-III C-methyltransferase
MTAEEGKRVISLYADEKRTASERLPSDSDAQASGPSTSTTTADSSGAAESESSSNLSSGASALGESSNSSQITPRHNLALDSTSSILHERKGKIFLLGSGPGSPALLTMAAHTLLTKHATLILSDKLVPSEILALIPPSIPLIIAKKFPGNAEGAQNELMDLAYQGALKGEIVVRLKQGDPYVYGRGGEEVLFFRERGFESIVVPGISSAFAAPLMAGIPVTQRGVSESVTVTTGVGRKGKGVKLPGYERSRTLTVLMGVARLEGVVNALISRDGTEGNGREGGGRQGAAYPPYCPIAIIEKGSSPDQRLVASTLEGIVNAMERVGEQRPPGMMLIGWSVLALEGKGDVEVLDGVEGLSESELEDIDRKRVDKWLRGESSIVREGLDSSWSDLVALQGDEHAAVIANA